MDVLTKLKLDYPDNWLDDDTLDDEWVLGDKGGFINEHEINAGDDPDVEVARIISTLFDAAPKAKLLKVSVNALRDPLTEDIVGGMIKISGKF